MPSSPGLLEQRLYATTAIATGGRDGRVTTTDGTLDLVVKLPPALGGPAPAGATNPEQLFAAGYAACFGSAVAHVARTQKLTTGPVHIAATVALGPEGGSFGLAVELVATFPELPRAAAEALVHAAHEVCPYSKATRGNIVVDVRVA